MRNGTIIIKSKQLSADCTRSRRGRLINVKHYICMQVGRPVSLYCFELLLFAVRLHQTDTHCMQLLSELWPYILRNIDSSAEAGTDLSKHITSI